MTTTIEDIDPDHEPTARELLAAANKQTAAALSLQGSVDKLAKSAKRNWRLVVLDIALSVALGIVGWFAVSGSNSADSAKAAAAANQEALNATCISSNEVRAKEQVLWNKVLFIFKSGTTEPAGLATIHEIQDLANRTFQLRNCSAVNQANKANSKK